MRERRSVWNSTAISAVALATIVAGGGSARAGTVADETQAVETLFYFVEETGRCWPQFLADIDARVETFEGRPAAELRGFFEVRDRARWTRAEALFATQQETDEERCVDLYDQLAATALDVGQRSKSRDRLADIHIRRGERFEEAKNYAAALDEYRAAVANAPEYQPGYVRVGVVGLLVAENEEAAQDFEAALSALDGTMTTLERGLPAGHPQVNAVSERRAAILASTGELALTFLGDARSLARFKDTGVDFASGEIRLDPVDGGATPPVLSAAQPRRVRVGSYRATIVGSRPESVVTSESKSVSMDVEVRRDGASMSVPAVIPDRMVWVQGVPGSPSFLCDRYEVSNAEFAAFVAAEGGSFTGGADGDAASGVSFADAQRYAQWIGKQLPTLGRWRHAAFGAPNAGSPRYPWGDNEGRPGVHFFGGQDASGAVGGCEQGQSVATHVFNLAGNVLEWLDDGWLIGGGFVYDIFGDDVDYGQATDGVVKTWTVDLLRDKIPTSSILDRSPFELQNKYKYYQIDETDEAMARQLGLRCVIPLE